MSVSRGVWWLSWPLLACGVFLLISGAREVLVPVVGQRDMAADWESHSRGAVCRLFIPRIDAHLFVVEGDSSKELRIGPGHMPGSAQPGTVGNCIIAGHRDTHFRILKDLRKGDDIVLETSNGKFRYRVTSLAVVAPHDRQPLLSTATPVLSLITCYPFYYVGPAPKRFVVKAELQ